MYCLEWDSSKYVKIRIAACPWCWRSASSSWMFWSRNRGLDRWWVSLRICWRKCRREPWLWWWSWLVASPSWSLLLSLCRRALHRRLASKLTSAAVCSDSNSVWISLSRCWRAFSQWALAWSSFALFWLRLCGWDWNIIRGKVCTIILALDWPLQSFSRACLWVSCELPKTSRLLDLDWLTIISHRRPYASILVRYQ